MSRATGQAEELGLTNHALTTPTPPSSFFSNDVALLGIAAAAMAIGFLATIPFGGLLFAVLGGYFLMVSVGSFGMRYHNYRRQNTRLHLTLPLPLPPALTEEHTFNLLFNGSTNSMLESATEDIITNLPEATDTTQLIMVMNRLFQKPVGNLAGLVKEGKSPEAEEVINTLFNHQLNYGTTSNPKPTTDAATIQFLEFSYLLGHLRKDPTLLPEVDRDELGRAYAKFRDEKFLPYCEAKYGVEATNAQVRGCIIPTLEGFVERGEGVSLELFPENLKRARKRDEQDRQRREQEEREIMSMEDGLTPVSAQQLDSGEEERKGMSRI